MDWVALLELPNIKVVDVRLEPGNITFHVECVNGTASCPRCGTKCASIHSQTKKKVKDLPILKRKCFIMFQHRRFICPKCNETFMERLQWVDQHERYTSRYAEWVAEAGKELDVKKAAKLVGESYKVVERIVYYRSKELELPLYGNFPERFGIDEFSYKRGKKDYGVVIGSAEGKVHHVLPSRKEENLRNFFSRIGKNARDRVASVTVDMWNTFINLIEEFFPNARIVNDRFHVMKLMNKVVDKVRKSVQKQLSEEERKELKGLRFVLLKNREDLQEEEELLLRKAFSYSEKIHKAYLRKEEFRNIFEKNTSRKKAEQQLDTWMVKSAKVKHRCMTTFLKTLRKRKEYVLNYFESRESNGFMEGIVNKVKTVLRQHYGFTNFGHLRTKILLSFT
jgi:transposase